MTATLPSGTVGVYSWCRLCRRLLWSGASSSVWCAGRVGDSGPSYYHELCMAEIDRHYLPSLSRSNPAEKAQWKPLELGLPPTIYKAAEFAALCLIVCHERGWALTAP